MVKAILFDLDGVLTNTSEHHYLAWKHLADDEHIPFTKTDNDALRGVSRRQSLELLLKGKIVSEEHAQEMMERKNGYYVALIKDMTPDHLSPGVLSLLRFLRSKHIRVAVVSSSKNAQTVVEKIGLQSSIDTLIDGSRVQKPKPEPDLFLLAAKELAVSPYDCVVVEDAEAGVEAAHRAHMSCIGIGETAHGAEATIPSIGVVTPTAFLMLANEIKEAVPHQSSPLG